MGEAVEHLQASRETRWRVDLKWVFGIPFTVLLMLMLVCLSLFQMTGREKAVETLTAMNQPVLAEQEFQEKLNAGAPVLAAFIQSPGFAGSRSGTYVAYVSYFEDECSSRGCSSLPLLIIFDTAERVTWSRRPISVPERPISFDNL